MTENPRQTRLANIALALISLSISLFAVEFVLRGLHMHWPDTHTHDPKNGLFILKPNEEMTIGRSCFKNTIRTNSQGFHAFEYEKQKAPNTYRIAVVGDSFVEAAEVSREEHFTQLLEKKLQNLDSDTTLEIIPFGISGHGTLGNMQYYSEYVAEYEPDLVVHMLLPINDVTDDLGAFVDDGQSPFLPPGPMEQTRVTRVKKKLRNSALIMTTYNAYLSSKAAFEQKANPLNEQMEIFREEIGDKYSRSWEIQETLLPLFQERVQQDGSEYVLVSIGDGFRVHNQLFSKLEDKYKNFDVYNYDLPEEKLDEISARHNIDHQALFPVFKKRATVEGALTVWDCDGHWNKRGHAWAADALLPVIEHAFVTSSAS